MCVNQSINNVLILFPATELSNQSLGFTTSRIWVCSVTKFQFLRLMGSDCVFVSSEELVQAESKVFPLIIAVSGRVGSETPLKCEQSGILGFFYPANGMCRFLERKL